MSIMKRQHCPHVSQAVSRLSYTLLPNANAAAAPSSSSNVQLLCNHPSLTGLLVNSCFLPRLTPFLPPLPSAHASLLTQEEYFKLIGEDMPVAFESNGSFKG